jgi:hypothetical protein
MPATSGKLLPVLFTKRRNSGFPHQHRWQTPQNCATNPTEEGIAEIFGFIESLYA